MNKVNINQQIVLAYHLYKMFGKSLFQDEKCRTLLLQLDQDIEATQKEMVAIGVVKESADCAVNGDGTCCGKRTGIYMGKNHKNFKRKMLPINR